MLQFITHSSKQSFSSQNVLNYSGQNEPLQDPIDPKLEDTVVLVSHVAIDLTCLMCSILIKANQCQAGLNFCMVSLSSLGHKQV